MSTLNKLLLVLFIVLLLIAVGEILFYFLYKPGEPPQQALSNNTLSYLKEIKTGNLTSSLLKNVYEGQIISIDRSSGTDPDNGYAYSGKITIKGEGGNVNTFYLYEKSSLKRFYLFQMINGNEVPTKILPKPGEKIRVQVIYNLFEELRNNLVSVKIIKI